MSLKSENKIEATIRRLMLDNHITLGEAIALASAAQFARTNEVTNRRISAVFEEKYGTSTMADLRETI
jgi:uncharacterized protein YoaH (UPF0181 family)